MFLNYHFNLIIPKLWHGSNFLLRNVKIVFLGFFLKQQPNTERLYKKIYKNTPSQTTVYCHTQWNSFVSDQGPYIYHGGIFLNHPIGELIII